MDQLKDIVKKYGFFIALGGLGLAFISIFLPFVSANILGYRATASFIKDGFWAVLVLILIVLACGITAIEAFAKQVFDAAKDKTVELLINYLPIGFAGLALLITFIEGMRAITSYTHLSVGFYFMILGLLVAAGTLAFKRFMLKEMFKFDNIPDKVVPQAQPYQQPQTVQPTQPVEPEKKEENK